MNNSDFVKAIQEHADKFRPELIIYTSPEYKDKFEKELLKIYKFKPMYSGHSLRYELMCLYIILKILSGEIQRT